LPRGRARAWLGLGLGCAALLGPVTRGARAAEPSAEGDDVDPKTLSEFRRLSRPRGIYGRISTALMVGRGLRFNNPYRLSTQLGETAESLSLTATYLDASFAMSFGAPDSIQHGAALHLSFSLEGVPQQAISASYVLGYRAAEPFLVYGRLGPSLLVAPDANVGGELAAGAAYMVTGVFGVTAEIVGNLYYGAGTYASEYTAYPILSAQLGLVGDLEVLP